MSRKCWGLFERNTKAKTVSVCLGYRVAESTNRTRFAYFFKERLRACDNQGAVFVTRHRRVIPRGKWASRRRIMTPFASDICIEIDPPQPILFLSVTTQKVTSAHGNDYHDMFSWYRRQPRAHCQILFIFMSFLLCHSIFGRLSWRRWPSSSLVVVLSPCVRLWIERHFLFTRFILVYIYWSIIPNWFRLESKYLDRLHISCRYRWVFRQVDIFVETLAANQKSFPECRPNFSVFCFALCRRSSSWHILIRFSFTLLLCHLVLCFFS